MAKNVELHVWKQIFADYPSRSGLYDVDRQGNIGRI